MRYFNREEVVGWFGRGVGLSMQRLAVSSICRITTNVLGDSLRYKWLPATARPQKWEGERKHQRRPTREHLVLNELWESSVGMDVDAVRRARSLSNDPNGASFIGTAAGSPVDVVGETSQELGEHFGAFAWYLLTQLLKNGDTSAVKAYDGSNFFATAHANNGNTINNAITASEVTALNIASAAAPTVAEASAALLGSIAYMRSYKDEAGNPVNEGASEFLAVVPWTTWASFAAAVSVDRLDSGAMNALWAVANSVGDGGTPQASAVGTVQGGLRVNVVSSAELDWTTEFALLRTDTTKKPFVLQEEMPHQIKILDEDSEHAFKFNEIVVGAKWNGNVGTGRFESALKATFS